MRSAIAGAVVLLAACTTAPIQVPEATQRLEVEWRRVGYFELQQKCGGDSPLAVTGAVRRQMQACAFVTPTRCIIYTQLTIWPEQMGHEMLHCFGWLHGDPFIPLPPRRML